jgi:hypothetical protein
MKVEVFRLDDQTVLENWQAPKRPNYRGMHGITVPIGEQ